ncbi:EamA family transporter RarD [Pseudomonas sp. B392_1p]|uniref:EamA family transporter RarD n=1 Tax=Pseudomonas sp. B392_1p TaxID=3457507 RepID=UPI003FD6A103
MSKGVVLSVMASVLFAALYYLSTLLVPLSGTEIFGWRVILTLPCLMLFISLTGGWSAVAELTRRVRAAPWLVPGMVLCAFLFGVQLWLFLWAPLQGRGLNVSLGYFLLPLSMILVGRLLFNERLSRLQQLATLLAVCGVANQILVVGGLAWETWLVALGYPGYFALRRKMGTDGLGGMWFEMILMVPVALWFAWAGGEMVVHFSERPRLFGLVPLMGMISAWALISYLMASRLLPLGLFGLLGYVEPVLLVLVSLLIGERIQSNEWLTYIPIWAAVLVLVLEGARHVWRRHGAAPSTQAQREPRPTRH